MLSSRELVHTSLLLGGQLVLQLLEEVCPVLVELACQTAAAVATADARSGEDERGNFFVKR